jgi:hypothetical protein
MARIFEVESAQAGKKLYLGIWIRTVFNYFRTSPSIPSPSYVVLCQEQCVKGILKLLNYLSIYSMGIK